MFYEFQLLKPNEMQMSHARQIPVKVEAKEPLNITTIAIVVALLLFAVGLAYSQGWLNSSSSNIEVESNKVGINQTIDQEQTREDAAVVALETHETAEPAQSTTK